MAPQSNFPSVPCPISPRTSPRCLVHGPAAYQSSISVRTSDVSFCSRPRYAPAAYVSPRYLYGPATGVLSSPVQGPPVELPSSCAHFPACSMHGPAVILRPVRPRTLQRNTRSVPCTALKRAFLYVPCTAPPLTRPPVQCTARPRISRPVSCLAPPHSILLVPCTFPPRAAPHVPCTLRP